MNENTAEQVSSQAEAAPEQPQKKKILKLAAKISLWTAGVIVLLLIGVFIFRDLIVETAVCKAGSYLTGTRVDLKNFSTSLSGEVRIQGFSVGNPKGFSNAKSIAFDEIFIHIDLPSLFGSTINIHRILIDGMAVNLESNFKTTNLNAIQNNINAAIGGSSEESSKPSAEEKNIEKTETAPDSTDNAKQLYIAKLETRNSALAFTSSTIDQTLSLPMPPVSLSDIGGKSIADTINELFGILLSSVSKTAANLGGAAAAALNDAGMQIGDALNKTGRTLSENSEKLGKDLKKTGSNFLKSLKTQLKNK